MNTHDIRQIARDLYPYYDQLAPLGQGGMGDLFKGRKTGLNVPVVIKIIKSNLKGRLDERQEAEILKGLKHKYLPRIYDVIENKDGYLYTIMDYIPGENLKDYVARTGPVDQKTAYRWGQQLCEVVAYLHAQTPAIIHSDIKPGNVMVTPEGDICLIDFNTSMELRAGLTAIGKTRGYAAPEQYTKPEQVLRNMQAAAGLKSYPRQNTILTPKDESAAEETVYLEQTGAARTGTVTKAPNMGSRSSLASGWFRGSRSADTATRSSGNEEYYGTVTKRTDVYAIGATLSYALTGITPHHALEPARPLSTFRLPVSRALVQIIERAMEKQPKDRFCDAAEMGKALQDIHRLDGNYRKARILTIAGILLEVTLLFGGIALMATGSAMQRRDNEHAYTTLLNDAQRDKNSGAYDAALDKIQQAQSIELMDNRMEAHAEEAAVYYDRGVHAVTQRERKLYFQQCVDKLEEMLKAENLSEGTDDEWAKAYFVGAESCVALEKYVRAQQWYRKAVDCKPSESAYRGLVSAYAYDGKTQEAWDALEQMQEALGTADTTADAALIQAELCYLEKDYAGAVEYYKTLLANTTDEVLLRRTYFYANNACIYGAETTPKEANAYLMQSIAFMEEACERLPFAWETFQPLLANSCYTLAMQSMDEGRKVWQQRSLEAYASVLPEYLSVEERLRMNSVRVNLGLLEDAQTDLMAMAELYPEDYRVHTQMAIVYLSQHAATSDIQYLRKAERAKETAKTCYENSGTVDPEMDVFLKNWEQILENNG